MQTRISIGAKVSKPEREDGQRVSSGRNASGSGFSRGLGCLSWNSIDARSFVLRSMAKLWKPRAHPPHACEWTFLRRIFQDVSIAKQRLFVADHFELIEFFLAQPSLPASVLEQCHLGNVGAIKALCEAGEASQVIVDPAVDLSGVETDLT